MMKKNKTQSVNEPTQSKVFDVIRPGKTQPSATSRPVIVGHKPQVQDPMMSVADDKRPLMNGSQRVSLQPIQGNEAEASPQEQVSPPAPSVPEATSAEELTPTAQTESAPAATEPDLPHATEPDADAAADLALVAMKDVAPEPETPAPAQATPATPQTADPLPQLDEEEPAPHAQVIVSHHGQHNPGKIFVAPFVLFILALVVLDLLLDSGIVTLEGVPHTQFF